MGQYKVITEMAVQSNVIVAKIITLIINISIMTAQPLKQWQWSEQVLLEEGRWPFVEHLFIAQLCEADLHFVLNIIWGYH
jgi:hypothetical protein